VAPEPVKSDDTTFDRRQRDRGKKGQQRQYRFIGRCKDLKETVYDVATRSSTFAHTTRDIAEYIARKFKDAGEFRKGMVEMLLPILDKPNKPDNTASPIDIKTWELDLRENRKKVESRKTKTSSWWDWSFSKLGTKHQSRQQRRVGGSSQTTWHHHTGLRYGWKIHQGLSSTGVK